MDSAMAEAREVMTPEQRTIWDKKMKSRQDWMERHANHRMKKHD
jgi:hypothetical protein